MKWIKNSSFIWYIVCTFFLIIPTKSRAQDSCKLRISVLTCGVGDELYSIYGHSAVRVVDTCAGKDIVFNYGTFDFGDPDFYLKFTRGKLLYYLDADDFNSFIQLYVYEKRSVQEQVLNLKPEEAQQVYDFLLNNLREENKYYKYDFLFDNCSTRIRDLFAQIFKDKIRFNPAISSDSLSFRNILDYYERNLHWERVGINILMSSIVDRKMTSNESMFLPDYLMKGLDNTTLDGNQLVKSKQIILEQGQFVKNTKNIPLIIFWMILVLFVLISLSSKLKFLLKGFDIILFTVMGLLGIFILLMWLGTEHKVCGWNLNLVWAFPLHLIFVYYILVNSDKKIQYAKQAYSILIIGILYAYFSPQKFIPEITPLLLLLFWRLHAYSRNTLFKNKFFIFKT